ncbi:hypothetical protein JJJ17_11150 [Paracoccus caeni]|uniref:Uncharacterized protein n=1 Tax=Paracoccus caeni TaxID=657651 RepID=A0A934W0M2_9RHOB|nr:contractile injection system tape measure protein [Paracoccus caeni]MBK4216483.1 hypothetical protein [Paracoccus caeni]
MKSLALGLRLPDQRRDQAGRLQDVVERRFLPAVLQSLRAELDATYGSDAVIRIPYLRLRLNVGPQNRDAAALARQLGRDLAGQVRDGIRVVRPGSPQHATADEARLWPDRAAFLASAMIAAVRRAPGPDGQVEPAADTVGAVLREPAGTVQAVMSHCEQANALEDVLTALPDAMLRELVKAAEGGLAPSIRRRIAEYLARQAREEPESRATSKESRKRTRSQAATPEQAGEGPPEDKPIPSSEGAKKAEPQTPKSDAVSPNTPQRRDPLASSQPTAPTSPSQQSTTQTSRKAARTTPPPPDKEPQPSNAPHSPDSPTVPPVHPASTDQMQVFETGWGGLVYLLNVALRLGMPEALWRIGVPEGEALAEMLAIASGTDEDPAATLPAPGFPQRPKPQGMVAEWARDEFCEAILTAVRSLTDTTDLSVRIEARRAALAEDQTWRLTEWAVAALVVTLHDLLSPEPAPSLEIPGRIEVTDTLIRICLPLGAIDLGLRRAGLDANPGYLPWLDRRVEIAFGSDEEDWAL